MNFFKSKSVTKPFYLSFTIFFCVIIVVCIIVSFISISHYRKNITDSNKYLLSLTGFTVDDFLDNAATTAANVSTDSAIVNAAKQEDISGKELLDIARILRSYTLNITYNNDDTVSNIYLYLFNKNTIISGKSTSVDSSFFNTKTYLGDEIDSSTILNSVSNGKFYPYNTSDDSGCILCVHSIFAPNSTTPLGTVIVMADKTPIYNLLLSNKEYTFTILDTTTNNLLFSNSDKVVPLPELYRNLSHTPQINRIQNKTIFTILSSKIDYMGYAYTVPNRVYLSPVNTIVCWIIALFLILITFFIMVIMCFTKFGYAPLKSFLNNISDSAFDDFSADMNEIDYLSEEFQRQIGFRNDMRKTIDAQNRAILNQKILLAIHDSGNSDISQLFESVESGLYYVMVISVQIRDFRQTISPINDWLLYQYAILNILSELMEDKFEFFSADLDNYTIPIILKVTQDDINIKDELSQILKLLFDVVKNEFEINLSVAISNPYSDDNNTHKAYLQAIECLNYKHGNDPYQILFYDDTQSKSTEIANYYYPIDVENKLINCILTGNTKEVQEIYKDILDTNFKKINSNKLLAQCLYYDILATHIKVTSEFSRNNADVQLPQISASSTIEDIKSSIQLLINSMSDLCMKINQSSHIKTSSSNIITYIEEYVRNHLDDHNLGVNTISDALNLTPQYISMLFHQTKKQKLSHYIALARIEKAKILLTETNMSIAQIADSLGYSNDISFSRVFKRFEGVPPGNFRKKV